MHSPDFSLDPQFDVGWAGLIPPEAMLHCMIQLAQPKVFGASTFSTIEKRTMVWNIGHVL